MRTFAALLLTLTLAGCASTRTASSGSPFKDITKLEVSDLTAALARATAADDKPAIMCFAGLLPIVKSLPQKAPNLKVAGVADAFEAARLLAKKAQTFSGASDPLIQNVNLACAALENDAQGDILRLGIKFRP